ncbi:hypothetical protein [Actinomadura sp. BRA 177]|uniref:hypothetical protein n=1 Tax=Actinomadura sp. BRA 177 TaxID=2745202 RepID=UPI00159590E4|nr:hypothetical protein [Actinomadura sp. BRA 177]NVI92309.1 hypothetical protein [Actinomadura sp. BRA 177]
MTALRLDRAVDVHADGRLVATGPPGDLAGDAARELALAEVRWSYDGGSPRRTPGGVAVRIRGYTRVFGRGASRRPPRRGNEMPPHAPAAMV